MFFAGRFLVGSMLIILIGCASSRYREIKVSEVDNVGVALLFEDTLPVAFIGTTVFDNSGSMVNISKWNLNQLIVQKIESGLKSIGKTYKKVQFDKEKIKAAIENGKSTLKRLAGNSGEELLEYLSTTAQNQGAKYLFIFQPLGHANYPMYPKGFGLFCRSAFGVKGNWEAYSLFLVSLWDLSTKEVVFSKFYTPDDTKHKSIIPCEEKQNVPVEKFVESFKSQFQELAKESVDLTLKKSGLIP